MREIRQSGSEGGETGTTGLSLPLSLAIHSAGKDAGAPYSERTRLHLINSAALRLCERNAGIVERGRLARMCYWSNSCRQICHTKIEPTRWDVRGHEDPLCGDSRTYK